MITAIDDMIEEARKKAKTRRAPANERIRWTRLAGQLIWYKDSILRSMTQEAMERELIVLKQQVLEKKSEEKPQSPTWLHVLRPATPQVRLNDQDGIVSDSAPNKARQGYYQPKYRFWVSDIIEHDLSRLSLRQHAHLGRSRTSR